MFSRRRFLGASGLGMLTLSSRFQLPNLQEPAHSNASLDDRITQKARQKVFKNRLLGYPVNMNTPSEAFFDWRRKLCTAGIDQFAFNNVGNPFKESPIPYNTHDFERDTILSFGTLFGFPFGDTWGFLSHSGTDSNMHGMYMGRTLLKGRTGVLPKAYFTREAHYSVQILRDLLGLEMVQIDTRPDGGMDPDDLAEKLSENANTPALVVATIGTTFKGSIDNIDQIKEKLGNHPHYLHLDAALFGGYLPFTNHAAEIAYRTSESDLSGRYDSIAVSCHKFFGFPSPAGLFITTDRNYEEFNALFSEIHHPEYIHQVPGTITCSRDAVKPAEFYFFTTPSAVARQTADANLMLRNTGYLFDRMSTRFPQMSAVRSNPLSNTVYFRYPGKEIVKKYSLATMNLDAGEKYAHAIVMPHVSLEIIDEFLGDLGRRQS